MIYLSGATGPRLEPFLLERGAGLVIQPRSYRVERVRPFAYWAADNGCYPPRPNWSPAGWLRMLGAIDDLEPEAKARCVYVLGPDMPFDHAATLERFARWRPVLEVIGLPIGFAIQDGATTETVPWDRFAVAFLAGSTAWKTGYDAYALAHAARRRGKWVHMGRVNSWRRFDWAARIGADSADGMSLAHAGTRELAIWLDRDQPRLTQMGAAV